MEASTSANALPATNSNNIQPACQKNTLPVYIRSAQSKLPSLKKELLAQGLATSFYRGLLGL